MILIGSKAIKHWFPDFPREPKDTDYVINEYEHFDVIKTEGVEYLKNKVLTDLIKTEFDQIKVPDPNILCTLKASHLCWDINWDKHMWDLQFLLKKGCEIDEDLFWKLYEFWNKYHGKNKRSDLKMSKDDFFTNAINYDTMEHDEVHKLINPIPIYTLVLKDGAEVELDENKFYSLSYEQKLDFVREEIYVMAFERYKNLKYKQAYHKMLKKFIISHAPSFSLLFILKNYVHLQRNNFNFIKHIQNELQSI